MKKTVLFKNIGMILTLSGVRKKGGRHVTEEDLGIIQDAALVAEDGIISWIGPRKSLPKTYLKIKKIIDLKKQTLLPGFVECHTHTVFSGSRAEEFELRNQGVNYQEIAARGGGILSTMKNTRESSARELQNLSQARVNRFLRQGVTTLEMKTGYALDFEHELKCLKVMKNLGPIRIVPTYLGAHALPPEFKSTQGYLDFILKKVLPEIKKKKLAKRVDIFIEKSFFDATLAKKYLSTVKDLGFDIVIHADQLSLSGGADVATELQALSADHLIQIQDSEIKKLAKSKTTCVLLPAADLYMDCAYPPARKLLEAGARVALATDFNPGSSPTQDLNLVGLLARIKMKMTLPEVIAAYTFNAACALGLENEIGSLEVGKSADFMGIKGNWQELFYSIGVSQASSVYFSGQQISE